MKKLIVTAILVTVSAAAFAQKPGIITAEEKALLITDKMKTEGLITPDQFDQVYAINLEVAKKKEQKREEMRSEMEKYRAEQQKTESQRMTAYAEVLDEEQLQEIKIAKAKKKAKMIKRHSGKNNLAETKRGEHAPRKLMRQH